MFTDLHVDYAYTPGKSNTCAMTVCCRGDSGEPKTDSERAGDWGDIKCDLPEKTIMSMFDYINANIKPDIAFWGGDSTPHSLASLTAEDNLATLKRIGPKVRSGLKDIKMYIALGNHDTYPQDSFIAT